MKLRFTGMIEKRKSGCGCRGASTGAAFISSKFFILPSGAKKTFRVGVAEEVTEQDADFLLSYNYTDPRGTVHNVFEVVS